MPTPNAIAACESAGAPHSSRTGSKAINLDTRMTNLMNLIVAHTNAATSYLFTLSPFGDFTHGHDKCRDFPPTSRCCFASCRCCNASTLDAARAAGFRAVEIQIPYEHSARSLTDAARAAEVAVILINAPMGEDPRSLGTASLPQRASLFRAELELAAEYAQALGTGRSMSLPVACSRRTRPQQWAD